MIRCRQRNNQRCCDPKQTRPVRRRQGDVTIEPYGPPSPDSVAKRARDSRRLVTMPVRAMLDDRSTFSVTILDLSYDGCKIETALALSAGQHVELTVPRLGSLTAYVRWYSNGKAGLSFGTDRPETEQRPIRQHERIPLETDVLLRRAARLSYTVTASDISPTGCKIGFVEQSCVGERLWVKFDGLEPLEGEVSWIDGFIGGIKFTRAIHPAVFQLLLARLIG